MSIHRYSRLPALFALATATVVGVATPAAAGPSPVPRPLVKVAGWGANFNGQLGTGTKDSSRVPVPVPALPTNTRRIAAGSNFALALLSDGTVLSWGDNFSGQLGDGTNEAHAIPARIPSLSGITQISAGDWHALAVDSAGNVWSWGDNVRGQLGDGTTVSRSTPEQVPGLTGFTQVSAGARFSLGVRGDGTVWAWGANDEGQQGDGTQEDQHVPHQVDGIGDVTQVAGAFGGNHSLALRADGTVWGWGANFFGQLGTGSPSDIEFHPVQAVGLSGATEIVAGEGSSLALRDGRIWAWGGNYFGQLGDGTTDNRAVPAPLGLTGVRQVVTGYSQSAVLLADGSMWTWGSNFAGEQGTGVPDPFTTVPAKVPGLADLARLALGFSFDLVIAAPRQPLLVLVPNLTGATASDAENRLRDAGLFGQHSRSGPCGRVVNQDPAPGTAVSIGSVVRIELGCTSGAV